MKKFLSYFNMFDMDLNSRSYKSGLIRIMVSAVIMLTICLVRLSITIENPILNAVISLLMIAVFVLSVLCLFIAMVECLQVGDNRKKDKERNQ